jgi:serine/threonine protein kinase
LEPHIVKLLRAEFTPTPKLCLEYMLGGSLDTYENLSVDGCGQVLCQCLSALTYLHGVNPPIVHRDIKPGNILVQAYDAGSVWVKFGDFDLSRQSTDPTTLCGTLRYFPPEMHGEASSRAARHSKRSYTAAVDIWSLGVVILDLLPNGLPFGKDDDLSWCKRIVKKLNAALEETWDTLLQFLSDSMVTMEPKDRGSAQACYDLARTTFGEGSHTPCQIDTTTTTTLLRTRGMNRQYYGTI